MLKFYENIKEWYLADIYGGLQQIQQLTHRYRVISKLKKNDHWIWTGGMYKTRLNDLEVVGGVKYEVVL